MTNYLKCSFKADVKNVSVARNITQAFLIAKDPTISFLNEVKTIISEAVTNAIIHGYKSDDTMEVYLNLSYDDEAIMMEIIDYGEGIVDIDLVREPMYTTKPEDDRSGLGFTIMEVFSDGLTIESTTGVGTTLRILKKWNEVH